MILSNKTTTPSGQRNTGLGVNSLIALTTGQDNTSIGANSLKTITDQTFNTAVGSSSLAQITALGSSASYNTAIGGNAGNTLIYGQYNCFLGQNSGLNIGVSQTDKNTFIGSNTTFNNPSSVYTQSTALGYGASISGSNQVVLGTSAETVIAPNIIATNNLVRFGSGNSTPNPGSVSIYDDITNGYIGIGSSITTGNISIGNTANTTNNGVFISGKYLHLFGKFIIQNFSPSVQYYPYETQTWTSTDSIIYYYKYNICNFTTAGYLYLDPPLYQYRGIELVIRQVGSASCLTSTVAGTNVFLNSANAFVSSLGGTILKVTCMPIGSNYYWVQI
jgi:hypothetical protein